jgi:predicted DNA-binding protein (MmcQ/YjbR family)
MAKHKWVLVKDMKKVSDAELKALVARSHALVAAKLPKRAQAKLDPGPAPHKRRPG